jgi:hypothetical protein
MVEKQGEGDSLLAGEILHAVSEDQVSAAALKIGKGSL